MPKLSGLINEREKAISRRLGELRSKIGCTQIEIAKMLGISRNQWAAAEYATTPLRYWLADRFCEKFDICQQWLASGEGPLSGYVKLPIEIGLEIGQSQLFSTVYERRVGHIVKRQIEDADSLKRIIEAQTGGADRLLQDRLASLADCWFRRIPPHLYQEFFGVLMAKSSEFFQRNRHRFSTTAWPSPIPDHPYMVQGTSGDENKMLTKAESAAKFPAVKSQLENLLADLNRLTQEPGMKTKLAEFLGAPLASVSRWLSGEREPGGETTLRLLAWVQAQEEKQESPGSASTPPEQETQVRKSTVYEKANSNPRKR